MTTAQLPPFNLRVTYPWMYPDAVFAAKFEDEGEYWLDAAGGPLSASSLISTTRSSGIILPDAAGVYQVLGNDVLPHTSRGLYANGQATNDSTNYNAAPPEPVEPTAAASFNSATSSWNVSVSEGDSNALFGIVDKEADLRSAGFGGLIDAGVMNGLVYEIDNRLGAVIASMNAFGQTGADFALAHRVSAMVWGSGAARVTTTQNVWGYPGEGDEAPATPIQNGAFTLNSTPTFRFMSFISDNGGRAFRVRAEPGARVWFILNKLEIDRGFNTPFIVTSGSEAVLLASDIRAIQGTRPSNGQPEPFPGWEAAGLDDGFTFLLRHEGRFRAASNRRLAGINGSSGFTRIETASNGLQFRVVGNDGVDNASRANGDLSGGPMLSAFTMLSDGSVSLTRSGVGTVNTRTIPYPVSPETLSVGATIGINPWSDWIEELQICPPLSDAQLLEWVNA